MCIHRGEVILRRVSRYNAYHVSNMVNHVYWGKPTFWAQKPTVSSLYPHRRQWALRPKCVLLAYIRPCNCRQSINCKLLVLLVPIRPRRAINKRLVLSTGPTGTQGQPVLRRSAHAPHWRYKGRGPSRVKPATASADASRCISGLMSYYENLAVALN